MHVEGMLKLGTTQSCEVMRRCGPQGLWGWVAKLRVARVSHFTQYNSDDTTCVSLDREGDVPAVCSPSALTTALCVARCNQPHVPEGKLRLLLIWSPPHLVTQQRSGGARTLTAAAGSTAQLLRQTCWLGLSEDKMRPSKV